MTGYWAAFAVALVVLVTIVELLRRRRLREKYAVLWLGVAGGIVVVTAFPGVLTWFADALGVQLPINLLFLVSSGVLLVVSLQLSSEISQLEEETRTIAEELAILRLDVEQWAHQADRGSPVPSSDDPEERSSHEPSDVGRDEDLPSPDHGAQPGQPEP